MEKIFAQVRFSFEIVCKVARSSPILFPLSAILTATVQTSTEVQQIENNL